MTAEHVEPGQPAGRDLGLGDGRRGEHERRGRRRSARRPGAAGAARARRGRRRRRGSGGTRRRRRSCSEPRNGAQRACPGSSERCSMSGLVRTYSRVVAGPVALLAGAVAVVGGRPGRRARAPPSAGELVLGERLGRREVEHGRAALAARPARRADRGQRRQLVGQGLAGGGAGRQHDVLARARGLGGDRLVPPRPLDPAGPERRDDVRRPPSPASRRAPPAAAGSTSRWRSRSSRPGTAASRSTTSRTLRGRDPRVVVTRSFSSTAPTPRPRRPQRVDLWRRLDCATLCAGRAGVVSLTRPDVGCLPTTRPATELHGET